MHINDNPDLQDAGQMYMETNKETILFAPLLRDSEQKREYIDRLLGSLGRNNIFKDEYHVLYTLIYDNPRAKISEPFLRLWLQTNRAIISQKRDSINFAQYKIGDNDEYAEFMTSTIATFNECVKHNVAEEDFETAFQMVKMEYTTRNTLTMLQNSAKIITEGMTVNRNSLAGFEGVKSYLTAELLEIDKVFSDSPFEGLVTYDENLNETDDDTALEFVTDFGIKGIDDYMGGIHTGDMVGILAPPKGYKSRLSAYIIHRTLVVHGNSCAVIPIENGRKGFESLIRAAHFNWYYNRGVTDVKQLRIIDNDMIRKNKLSPEMKRLEEISYLDLKTNPQYGRMTIISEAFELETFVNNIDRAVREKNAKLVLIDYLQLITGEGNIPKAQRVGMAYQALLAYQKRGNRIASLVPGQIKQDKLNQLAKEDDDDLADVELRDAGGESAEVIRTPDANLLIHATTRDIKLGRLQVVGLPSRNFQGFDPVKLHTQAGVCYFYEVPDERW